MAKLLGANAVNEMKVEQADEFKEIDLEDIPISNVKETEAYYKEKLNNTIANNMDYLDKIEKIKKEDLTMEDIQQMMNSTKDELISPFFNPQTMFYKADRKEYIKEVPLDRLADFDFDKDTLLEIN